MVSSQESNRSPRTVDAALERLLERSDVVYIHVRDTAAGCYDCRIERAA
jgi:phosphoglycerate dehydrogenase-like enzyme